MDKGKAIAAKNATELIQGGGAGDFAN